MEEKRNMKSSVLILCVNYRNDAETNVFVRAAAGLPSRAANIVVISNSPAEESGELESLNSIEGVQVLFPEKNLGYFGGAAYGLSSYLDTHPLPDWVIVSNTDITFQDQDFFEKLNEYYASIPLPAVVAPDIMMTYSGCLTDSPTYQNPYMRTRPSATKMRGFYFINNYYMMYNFYDFFTKIKHTAINMFFGKGKNESNYQQEKPEPIYAPFGAFIIFHRSYFERGGSLDYGCFLYGEEIFVAESTRLLNMSIIYDPRLKIIHRHHQTTNMIPSKIRTHYAREAVRYLVDTFFSE